MEIKFLRVNSGLGSVFSSFSCKTMFNTNKKNLYNNNFTTFLRWNTVCILNIILQLLISKSCSIHIKTDIQKILNRRPGFSQSFLSVLHLDQSDYQSLEISLQTLYHYIQSWAIYKHCWSLYTKIFFHTCWLSLSELTRPKSFHRAPYTTLFHSMT